MTRVERLHARGILRKGTPRSGFRYVDARTGRPVRGTRQRLAALRLPPAWRDVAISPSPRARLQAVGRDAAGRWQYVYHEAHVRERERDKLEQLLRLGDALPRLRRAVARDMRAKELTRDKVLATVVRILACAFIRPGSEVYAAENGSYGIATLRRKHVRVSGGAIHFDFPGKSGKRQQHVLNDTRAARIVRRLLELPGYEVFKYVGPSGEVVDVRRADINEYIKRQMGHAFKAKDFRTWSGTLICACTLARGVNGGAGATSTKRAVAAALRETAEKLGNTPAVCRSSYVSPCVLTSFERGRIVDSSFDDVEELIELRRGLHRSERALLRLLAASAPIGSRRKARRKRA